MVIIPVQELGDNPAANHWYVVICGVGSLEDSRRMAPRLIVMDSLLRTHEAETKVLRSFFFHEYLNKKGTFPTIAEKDFRREQVLTP